MEPLKFFGNAADDVMHNTSKAAVNATAAQAQCDSLAGSKQEVGKATFAGWLPRLLRMARFSLPTFTIRYSMYLVHYVHLPAIAACNRASDPLVKSDADSETKVTF